MRLLNPRGAKWVVALVAAALLAAIVFGAGALVMGAFSLPWRAVSSGGGEASSVGFGLQTTLGQPAVGRTSSGNFVVTAGFQAGLGAAGPGPSADLSLTKIVDDPTPGVGGTVVFTVTVLNGGPDDATGVRVTDLLPSGIAHDSDDSGGAYNPNTGLWTIGSLADQTSVTLNITATATSTGSFTNVAEVTASDLPDPDSTPGNGDAAEDDQASAAVDVAVLIQPVGPPSVTSGSQFDVVVQADSIQDLAGAQFSLNYDPILLTFIDAQPGGDFAGCLGQSNVVVGSLNLVLACSDGHSGAPLALWTVTFVASTVSVPTKTTLTITDVLLGDSQVPPLKIPGVGTSVTITIVPGVCGDQNDDDKVDVFDAIIDLQIIVGLLDPTPTQMLLSDVVRDGTINVFDVILVLKHIVGETQITECGPLA